MPEGNPQPGETWAATIYPLSTVDARAVIRSRSRHTDRLDVWLYMDRRLAHGRNKSYDVATFVKQFEFVSAPEDGDD